MSKQVRKIVQFGEMVEQHRTNLGLTSLAAAQKCGLTGGHFGRIERGAGLTFQKAIQIMVGLEIPWSYMYFVNNDFCFSHRGLKGRRK